MKKYGYRLIGAVLSFAIGLATFHFFVWARIADSVFSSTIHSSEKNSPYALLEGSTVRIKPYDATFEIPESWVENLYLSYRELNYLYRNDGNDAEEAQVINSVLSFGDCTAHIGNGNWGNYFWNDLQSRVYVVELNAEEIDEKLWKQGLSTAESVYENASLSSGTFGPWQKRRLDVLDAPTHFMLSKNIDFYYRRFADKTVVFVFIHAGDYDETINQILNSFTWPPRS